MKRIFYKAQKIFAEMDLIKFIVDNKFAASLILTMIISMIFGAVCVNYVDLSTVKKLDILFLSDFDSRSNQGELYTFVSSFTCLFLFWLMLITSALSALGVIIVPGILIFRSWGLGLTSGYLYLIYGLKGVAFYILVLLPGIFISSIAFICMSVTSAKFSIRVLKKFLPHASEGSLWNEMLLYIKKSGYILAIFMISSVIDMFFMKVFSNLFVF